jgi:vacuolar-type H+-ATPase subunit H
MSEAAHVLDAIRVAELEAAQRLEEVRAAAEADVAAARDEAARSISDARLRGRDESRRRLEAAVDAAEDEARSILGGCEARDEALRAAAAPFRDAAMAAMLDLLLAPPLEEAK